MSIQLAAFRTNNSLIGQSLTYSRGNQQVPFRGMIGQRTYEIVQSTGIPVEFVSTDCVAAQDDLKFGDEFITPKRGDKITAVNPVTTRTTVYSVQYPDQTKPPFRKSDHSGFVLRIHTIEIQ